MESPPGGTAPEAGASAPADEGPPPPESAAAADTSAPAAAAGPAGHPPPSPLSGGYLLIVIGEPHSAEHKDLILQRIAKGFLSWDSADCHVDLEKELETLSSLAPNGEEARNGERLVQYASESLVTEVLVHPQVNTLLQCVRNLLSSFTRHRHILHAGYTFAGTGSWILQDGTFSFADLAELFHEPDVQRVLRAYENSVSVDVHCCAEGPWRDAAAALHPFSRYCKVRVNPPDVLTAGGTAIKGFIDYVADFVRPAVLESLLEPSDVVGNIRFSHPTLYVFPGGQGDAALFGINGFNMLVDGGFGRKACFWDFARHLDRLDAVLLTRLNNANAHGLAALLRRKKNAHVYPQIGHFFCNLQDRKVLTSPDGDKDRDNLLVSLVEEGQEMVLNLRHLQLKPSPCYRDSVVEPVNLYHKVGHGKLDMYVVSPARDSREVKEFLAKWGANDSKLFASHMKKDTKEFQFPLQNIVSICALLVWQPANPQDTITRILFPGSTPQVKIFEGLDKIRHLEYLKHPTCTAKSLSPSPSFGSFTSKPQPKKYSPTVIDKITPGEQQKTYSRTIPTTETSKQHILKTATIPVSGGMSDTRVYRSAATISNANLPTSKHQPSTKKIEKVNNLPDVTTKESNNIDNSKIEEAANGMLRTEEATKSKVKSRHASQSRERKSIKALPVDKKDTDKKEKKEEKTSPTTPKKVLETKVNGVSSRSESASRLSNRSSSKSRRSPSATPAKSAKEANNRKVAELKVQSNKSTALTRNVPVKSTKKDELTETSSKAKSERQVASKRMKSMSPSKSNKVTGSPVLAKSKVTSNKIEKSTAVRKSRANEKDERNNTVHDKAPAEENIRKESDLIEAAHDASNEAKGLESSAAEEGSEEVKVLVTATEVSVTEIEKHVGQVEEKEEPEINREKIDEDLRSSDGLEPEEEEEDEYLVIEKEEPYTEESFQEQVSVESHAPHNLDDRCLSDDDGEDEKLKRDTQESEKCKDVEFVARKKSEPKLTMQLTDKEHAERISKATLASAIVLEKNLGLTGAVETKAEEVLSPENKEKIVEEVQEIILSASDIVSRKDKENVMLEELQEAKEGGESPISSEKPKDIPGDDIKIADIKQTSTELKEESQPDEKVSTTGESGATTAPTLPEDERIPLDEIKEVVEEKHVLEETKEKDLVITQAVQEGQEKTQIGRPGHFDIQGARAAPIHRDIIKTPDEVADLPVDEVYDAVVYTKEELGANTPNVAVGSQDVLCEIEGDLKKPENLKNLSQDPASTQEIDNILKDDEQKVGAKEAKIDKDEPCVEKERTSGVEKKSFEVSGDTIDGSSDAAGKELIDALEKDVDTKEEGARKSEAVQPKADYEERSSPRLEIKSSDEICVSLEELRILGHKVDEIRPTEIKREDSKYTDIEPSNLSDANILLKDRVEKHILVPLPSPEKESGTATLEDKKSASDVNLDIAAGMAVVSMAEPLEAVQEDVYLESSVEEEPVYGKTDALTHPEYVTVTPDSSPEGPKFAAEKKNSIASETQCRKSIPSDEIASLDIITENNSASLAKSESVSLSRKESVNENQAETNTSFDVGVSMTTEMDVPLTIGLEEKEAPQLEERKQCLTNSSEVLPSSEVLGQGLSKEPAPSKDTVDLLDTFDCSKELVAASKLHQESAVTMPPAISPSDTTDEHLTTNQKQNDVKSTIDVTESDNISDASDIRELTSLPCHRSSLGLEEVRDDSDNSKQVDKTPQGSEAIQVTSEAVFEHTYCETEILKVDDQKSSGAFGAQTCVNESLPQSTPQNARESQDNQRSPFAGIGDEPVTSGEKRDFPPERVFTTVLDNRAESSLLELVDTISKQEQVAETPSTSSALATSSSTHSEKSPEKEAKSDLIEKTLGAHTHTHISDEAASFTSLGNGETNPPSSSAAGDSDLGGSKIAPDSLNEIISVVDHERKMSPTPQSPKSDLIEKTLGAHTHTHISDEAASFTSLGNGETNPPSSSAAGDSDLGGSKTAPDSLNEIISVVDHERKMSPTPQSPKTNSIEIDEEASSKDVSQKPTLAFFATENQQQSSSIMAPGEIQDLSMGSGETSTPSCALENTSEAVGKREERGPVSLTNEVSATFLIENAKVTESGREVSNSAADNISSSEPLIHSTPAPASKESTGVCASPDPSFTEGCRLTQAIIENTCTDKSGSVAHEDMKSDLKGTRNGVENVLSSSHSYGTDKEQSALTHSVIESSIEVLSTSESNIVNQVSMASKSDEPSRLQTNICGESSLSSVVLHELALHDAPESSKLRKEAEDSEKTDLSFEMSTTLPQSISAMEENKTLHAVKNAQPCANDIHRSEAEVKVGTDLSNSQSQLTIDLEASPIEEDRKSGSTTPSIFVTECKSLARQSQPSESDTDMPDDEAMKKSDDVFEITLPSEANTFCMTKSLREESIPESTSSTQEKDSQLAYSGCKEGEIAHTVHTKMSSTVASQFEGSDKSNSCYEESLIQESSEQLSNNLRDVNLSEGIPKTLQEVHENRSEVSFAEARMTSETSGTEICLSKKDAIRGFEAVKDVTKKTEDVGTDVTALTPANREEEEARTEEKDIEPINLIISKNDEGSTQIAELESGNHGTVIELTTKESGSIPTGGDLEGQVEEPEFTLVSKSVHEEYVDDPTDAKDGESKKLTATTTVSTYTAKDVSDSPKHGEITKTVTTVTKVTTGKDGVDAMETTTTEKVLSEGKVTSITTKMESSPLHKKADLDLNSALDTEQNRDLKYPKSGLKDDVPGNQSMDEIDSTRLLLQSAVVDVVEGVASVSKNVTTGFEDAMAAGMSVLSSVVGIRKDSLDATRSCTPGSDIELEPSTPRSTSSGQVSRAATHTSEDEYHHESEDDDAPGSPTSMTSQITHSPPPPHFEFEIGDPHRTVAKGFLGSRDDQYMTESGLPSSQHRRKTIADPMASSFYGELTESQPTFRTDKEIRPLDDSEQDGARVVLSGGAATSVGSLVEESTERTTGLHVQEDLSNVAAVAFDRAVEEHRATRGSDLTRSTDCHTQGAELKVEYQTAKALDKSVPVLKPSDVSTSSGVQRSESSERHCTSLSPTQESSDLQKIEESAQKKKDPIEAWGQPLGLPSPIVPPTNSNEDSNPSPKGTPQKERNANRKINIDNKKRPESPRRINKSSKGTPIYIDLTYVPHHGNSYYSSLEFFKRVRARYYVFSGIEPSREVYNALLEAKQSWEDKDLEVTIIPTYDTDTLGYWVAENEEALSKYKIDLSPSASRCTINLQDHETSCSAYRLEF